MDEEKNQRFPIYQNRIVFCFAAWSEPHFLKRRLAQAPDRPQVFPKRPAGRQTPSRKKSPRGKIPPSPGQENNHRIFCKKRLVFPRRIRYNNIRRAMGGIEWAFSSVG
ncbi:MAG: hypothetical protein VB086_10935 [Clostridiaceae bacterium]|nr:hypothetical protein [Clostridiaceae bacterium]